MSLGLLDAMADQNLYLGNVALPRNELYKLQAFCDQMAVDDQLGDLSWTPHSTPSKRAGCMHLMCPAQQYNLRKPELKAPGPDHSSGIDCGVFVGARAFAIADGKDVVNSSSHPFTQSDMPTVRQRIGLALSPVESKVICFDSFTL